jgi:diaminopimelate decarboxylase
LDGIARELGLDQAIGLRINLRRRRLLKPRFFKCDLSSRFGFSIEEAYKILKQAEKSKNLQVKGIMTHPYHGAAEILLPFVKRIHDELGIEIDHVNLGGGFNPGIDIERVGKSVLDSVKQTLVQMEPTIVLEPGSFIAGDAGLLLLRVDHVKEAGGFKWVIVDGGTNLLPTGNEHYEVKVANRDSEPSSELVNIVGPIPSPIDSICLKKWLPRVHEGDLIAVLDCGAYSLSSSNQFLHPRPSVVMLTRDKGPVEIRKAETFEYVTQLDRTLDQGV